jgi:hypothetical protein
LIAEWLIIERPRLGWDGQGYSTFTKLISKVQTSLKTAGGRTCGAISVYCFQASVITDQVHRRNISVLNAPVSSDCVKTNENGRHIGLIGPFFPGARKNILFIFPVVLWKMWNVSIAKEQRPGVIAG